MAIFYIPTGTSALVSVITAGTTYMHVYNYTIQKLLTLSY